MSITSNLAALKASLDIGNDPHDCTHFRLLESISNDLADIAKVATGSVIETVDLDVTSNGTTITASIQKEGGGDLTCIFTAGMLTLAADTISLTAGTDASPTENWLYATESGGVVSLAVSTVSFPTSGEFIPFGRIVCQSASAAQTDGVYKVHAWTDHVMDAQGMGHLQHVNARLRIINAAWFSGVAASLTIGAGSPDTVDLATAVGVVHQLHDHDFPALDTAVSAPVWVVNDSSTAYTRITDLASALTDSAGVSMSGRYFALTIWGCVSEDASDCKLFMNLPSGSYNSEAALVADSSNHSSYAIPDIFLGTGFLIVDVCLKHSPGGGGTWTEIGLRDLRGLFPAQQTSGTLSPSAFVELGESSELTISSDAVTPTRTHHTVGTESAAATDDLATVNGLAEGRIVILRPKDSVNEVVTVKDGTGNMVLNGDFVMNGADDLISLMGGASNWREMFRSSPT